jgi:hypothetical protein
MTEYATLENILSQYLYGQLEMPDLPADRLRYIPSTETDPHTNLTIDAVTYMGTVGRFAELTDAKIVQDFFDGNITRSGY